MEDIARLVLDQYNKLPSKGKPLVRSNGVKEWTILAGIVIRHETLECVALATGVKSMPDEQIRGNEGKILHDCHAEVLAIRAFNLYCVRNGISHIREVHLYVCAPPCGDASMSLLKGVEWNDPPPNSNELLRGRAHFGLVGRVRTKPGRADSNVTMSKSCSDKLCLRQSRGLLLSSTKRLFPNQLFLTSLVCPQVLPDFERAFSRWAPTNRFVFRSTPQTFKDFHPEDGKPSPCSLIWIPNSLEVIANGIVQGSKGKPSMISRNMLLLEAQKTKPECFKDVKTYYDLKKANTWPNGWVRTAKDDFLVNT